MEWFELWFDTEYYHLLYQNRDEQEAEAFLLQLIQFLNIPPNAKIIDIGCGRGRHSRYLNDLGFDVTGIDISRNCIAFAKKFENQRLRFLCFDKRKAFIKEHFDYALNLFTSFGYLKEKQDLSSALNSMVRNLKNKGILVLDYFNGEKVVEALPYLEEVTRGSCQFQIKKEIVNNKVLKTIHVKDGNSNHTFHEEVHLISLEFFQQLFQDSGLKILHIFGDYGLRPFKNEDSDRMIIIGIKN